MTNQLYSDHIIFRVCIFIS